MSKNPFLHKIYKKLFEISTKKKGIEFSVDNEIGYGFYVGHPYGITINAKAIIGNNVNIHKGVTIGQENRGKRKGTPCIGNNVWIGVNATIVGNVVIGNDVNNVNIHKGVTIGQENRGKRKGTPCIGNNVWIGVNATIVGNVVIGNDVLIAPNTYINCDIPDHSIVFGNPCIVKHADDATKDYINHAV